MSKHVHVTVRQGILRGIVVKDYTSGGKFLAFRGIPYAKPPIGDLRFTDPEPAGPWTGVRDATKFGHMPPQFDYFAQKPIGNDDCLYLNVYTKEIALQTKRPVMAWIQGGGFHCGSGNYDCYGPNYIVAKDVVLVTINFRLGALGFLNLDYETAPGNQGLKDAVMALRWIHDNISNFGGNPGNVTIFGQGFGGSIVHFLAVCPQADGLFHKAISQSGTAAVTLALSDKETQKTVSIQLAELLLEREITDPKDAVGHLRTFDGLDIVEASLDLMNTNEERLIMFPFVPTVDCDSPNPFFVEHPKVLLRRGVKVPFIIGFTDFEGSVFVGDLEDALEQVNSDFVSIIHPNIWPTLEQKSITAADVYTRYFGLKSASRKTVGNYVSLISDMYFYCGIFETICIQAQTGTTHGEELPYLFYLRMSKNVRYRMGFQVRDDPKKIVMSKRITQMWTDFAKTGNPTPAITPLIPIKWTPLEKRDEFNFLIIDDDMEMEITEKTELRFCELL